MAGGDHIISLVLSPELVVIIDHKILVRVDLNRHVSIAVPGIVVIKAHREVSVEFLQAMLAHNLPPLFLDECGEWEVHRLACHVNHNADLHRNEIKDPGNVTGNLLGDSPYLADQFPSPNSFQIHGFCPEGILGQLC